VECHISGTLRTSLMPCVDMLEYHPMATKAHHTVANISAHRGKIPDSWIRAAGILRGKKPNPHVELRKMRAEWEKRLKALERSRR